MRRNYEVVTNGTTGLAYTMGGHSLLWSPETRREMHRENITSASLGFMHPQMDDELHTVLVLRGFNRSVEDIRPHVGSIRNILNAVMPSGILWMVNLTRETEPGTTEAALRTLFGNKNGLYVGGYRMHVANYRYEGPPTKFPNWPSECNAAVAFAKTSWPACGNVNRIVFCSVETQIESGTIANKGLTITARRTPGWLFDVGRGDWIEGATSAWCDLIENPALAERILEAWGKHFCLLNRNTLGIVEMEEWVGHRGFDCLGEQDLHGMEDVFARFYRDVRLEYFQPGRVRQMYEDALAHGALIYRDSRHASMLEGASQAGEIRKLVNENAAVCRGIPQLNEEAAKWKLTAFPGDYFQVPPERRTMNFESFC